MLVRLFVALFLWVLVCASAALYYSWHWLNTPIVIEQSDTSFVIERGENLHTVANTLASKKIFTWPKVWILYAKYKNLTNIKAGEYQLSKSETPIGLLDVFLKGQVVQYQVTLIEGKTLNQAIGVLHEHEKLEKTLEFPLDLEASLPGLELEHLEGWFYPDTYHFSAGDTDLSILLRAHERMRDILMQEWDSRVENLPYKNPYEALVMASIVEKETGAAFERDQIAGVFVRRLQNNMRLQTDPTIIYGMGDAYDGNIRRADIKRPTPYNTYVIRGLPPTPIALAGREAIRAALHPDSGHTLYFVARGDGTHQFSVTVEEHNSAVDKYQRKRVEGYRSNFQDN